MAENDTQFEFTGATVEEAIRDGLDALGLSEHETEIEIVEEGSKGLFGFGSKEAIVRMRYRPNSASHTPAAPPVPAETLADAVETHDPAPAATAERSTFQDGMDDEDAAIEVARATVAELIEKMGVKAAVTATRMPEDDFSHRSAIAVDIAGDDLSILIGRKAETLEALEFIARLIVGKELGASVILNLDVQGYRKRQEQRLRRTAQSVARQAVETGKRQYLEPMSPAERRIVHMELRNHPEVYTESVGEGDRRKVTINPKV